jgi:hypothetical protein
MDKYILTPSGVPVGSAEGILKFSVKRNVTNLFKEFLNIVQEFELQHNEALNKLFDTLPESEKNKVYLADHITKDYLSRIRKKVLSDGNDCYREIEAQLSNFDVDFKKK